MMGRTGKDEVLHVSDRYPELSIVVLCYRSEEDIIPFVHEVVELAKTLTDRWELVLVGNYIPGTPDRTKDIVRDLAARDSRFKAVIEPKTGMMGWDMRKGLTAAAGDYICVIDGDGQFPVESIERCFKAIKRGRLDLAKTYREKRHDGLYRICISKVYNFLFKLLFPGLDCRDVNSKPKILSREACERMSLNSDGWLIDAEIMINVRRFEMRFEEFPIVFSAIETRHSFVKFGALFEFTRELLRYRIQEFRLQRSAARHGP